MPELPEVECLTRNVRDLILGGQIAQARFLRRDLRTAIPVEQFQQLMVGQPITAIFRRSKYLLLQTAPGYAVIHLGMTGNLLSAPDATPTAKHTHVVLETRDKGGARGYLHFVDPRRFGRIDCIAGASYAEHPLFQDLGPEPLAHPDLGRHLFSVSRGRTAPVKAMIMDARVVVGVGNIYASESLFLAKIAPTRPAGAVTLAEYRRLARFIGVTLEDAIAAGGTTFRDYRNAEGDPGRYAERLRVYARAGEPCRRCKSAIVQIRQAGRSTFFCADCQS